MQTLKNYLINKGFTEIESTIYIKDIEVIADKILTVKVHTFKPHKTIWIKVTCEHEFFPGDIVYQGRLRTLNLFDEIYEALKYIDI